MSGLAGWYSLDGGPADTAALDAMADAIAHRGRDARSSWTAGPMGMVHLDHRTVEPARVGRQPTVSPDGHVCVVMDGRVDARAELREALGPDRATLRDGSDPELVLQTYLRWGRDAFARIVGDFVIVVWDGRRGDVMIARDPLGHRPLYFHQDATALRWASEVVGVLGDPGVPRRPNPGMVAEHLVHDVPSIGETVWDGVHRLPPAHLLTIGRAGVRSEPYWTWTPPVTGPPRSDADLIGELRSTLEAAVLDHLQGPGPITAELSGGLDSSSVVGLAAQLVDGGRVAGPLELASLVFPGTGFDESPYIDAVCAATGRPSRRFTPGPQGLVATDAAAARTLMLPPLPTSAMHEPLAADAADRESRILLTGYGGDEWLTGSRLVLADDLRHGRWRGLRHRMAADRLLWPARSPLRQLARDGLLPLVPWRRSLPSPAGPWRARAPWLRADFAASVELDDRLRRPPRRGPDLAAADIAGQFHDGWRLRITEDTEQAMARHGLEVRTPLEDRRVVELALALPDRLRRRDSAVKWALRLAVDGAVPDVVRERADKARFTDLVHAELEAAGGLDAFRELRLAELGWVDGPQALATYEAVRANRHIGRGDHRLWPIWTLHCTERWIRTTVPTVSDCRNH